jgi:hypothetical protein
MSHVKHSLKRMHDLTMTKYMSPCHINQGRDYKQEAILNYMKS